MAEHPLQQALTQLTLQQAQNEAQAQEISRLKEGCFVSVAFYLFTSISLNVAFPFTSELAASRDRRERDQTFSEKFKTFISKFASGAVLRKPEELHASKKGTLEFLYGDHDKLDDLVRIELEVALRVVLGFVQNVQSSSKSVLNRRQYLKRKKKTYWDTTPDTIFVPFH